MIKNLKNTHIIMLVRILIVILSLYFLQRLLMPKYQGKIKEGAFTSDYYKENINHDVLMVGDCELYENVSTVKMWEKYGINSYIRGNAGQKMWQTYYLLKEAFSYEKPKVVVINALSMKYNEPKDEAYNRMTIDYMKWSKNKIDIINASKTKNENFIEYVFPILRYHDRIFDLKEEDFKYLFNKKDNVTLAGYYPKKGVKKAIKIKKEEKNLKFGKRAYFYLNKIRTLCSSNKIKLIIIKAPILSPKWQKNWNDEMNEYSKKYKIPYYNLYKYNDEIKIDYNKDTYDGGYHLNYKGADKIGDFLGKILQRKYGVRNRKNDKKLCKIWEKRVKIYRNFKEEIGE